jgi:hypothetical protein
LASAEAVEFSGKSAFKQAAFQSYEVNGRTSGEFKSAGNLSWLKVFGAGHEVPFYRRSPLNFMSKDPKEGKLANFHARRTGGVTAGILADHAKTTYFLHVKAAMLLLPSEKRGETQL